MKYKFSMFFSIEGEMKAKYFSEKVLSEMFGKVLCTLCTNPVNAHCIKDTSKQYPFISISLPLD